MHKTSQNLQIKTSFISFQGEKCIQTQIMPGNTDQALINRKPYYSLYYKKKCLLTLLSMNIFLNW